MKIERGEEDCIYHQPCKVPGKREWIMEVYGWRLSKYTFYSKKRMQEFMDKIKGGGEVNEE